MGAELRVWRERAGLESKQVAHRLSWSPSKVSNMEAGRRGVSEVDAAMYLAVCRAPGDDIMASVFLEARGCVTHYRGILRRLATVALDEGQSRSGLPNGQATTIDRGRTTMPASRPRDRRWRKSSISTHGNANCLEVAIGSDLVGVRDSKNAGGGELDFSTVAWRAFVSDRCGSGR